MMENFSTSTQVEKFSYKEGCYELERKIEHNMVTDRYAYEIVLILGEAD